MVWYEANISSVSCQSSEQIEVNTVDLSNGLFVQFSTECHILGARREKRNYQLGYFSVVKTIMMD